MLLIFLIFLYSQGIFFLNSVDNKQNNQQQQQQKKQVHHALAALQLMVS